MKLKKLKLEFKKYDKKAKPTGAKLVFLKEPYLQSRFAVANFHPNIVSVGGSFEFDAPKILAYADIPETIEFE